MCKCKNWADFVLLYMLLVPTRHFSHSQFETGHFQFQASGFDLFIHFYLSKIFNAIICFQSGSTVTVKVHKNP